MDAVRHPPNFLSPLQPCTFLLYSLFVNPFKEDFHRPKFQLVRDLNILPCCLPDPQYTSHLSGRKRKKRIKQQRKIGNDLHTGIQGLPALPNITLCSYPWLFLIKEFVCSADKCKNSFQGFLDVTLLN